MQLDNGWLAKQGAAALHTGLVLTKELLLPWEKGSIHREVNVCCDFCRNALAV